MIIFGAVAGATAGAIAGVCAVTAQVFFWVVFPLWVRHEAPPPTQMTAPVCRPGLHSGQSGNTPAMLIRRIARPLLSAVFIGQGVETLRNPKVTVDAAEPTVAALRTLPEPFGGKIPSDPETAARINAAVQVGGGLLLATGKLPRIASAALAFTVIPGSLGGHLFWNESDPERQSAETPRPTHRPEPAGRADHCVGRHGW